MKEHKAETRDLSKAIEVQFTCMNNEISALFAQEGMIDYKNLTKLEKIVDSREQSIKNIVVLFLYDD